MSKIRGEHQDSLPEMPAEALKSYVRWIEQQDGAYFVSYQQENGFAHFGQEQTFLSEALSGSEKLRLLSRTPSWTRNGYTVEVYLVV